MPLRKSPLRTPALLAACRANARKSRGPTSARGKARSSLNALKHGRYAVHLRQKLLEAGDRQGEALYARIEARVSEAFCSGRIPDSAGMTARSTEDERQVRRLTSLVWCFASRRRSRRPPCPKTILECAMESVGCLARDLSEDRIQVHDCRRRIGLVFWVQRRRARGWIGFWERFRNEFRTATAGPDRGALGGLKRTGVEQTGPERTIFEQSGVLAAPWEWETGLRSRIFRLRRPNIWARLHYGLDKDGVYSSKIEARGRRELKKLCLAGIPVSSWPPLLSPEIYCSLIPYGFENMA